MRARVAIAGCRASAEAAPDELYPNPDAGPLLAAFAEAGVPASRFAWDDPLVAWDTFSHVLVDSTWDGVDRRADYLAWLGEAARSSILVNDLETILWGFDKAHQRELAEAGVPVIPTQWLEPGAPLATPGWSELVVKPAVSAGARSTARYRHDDERLGEHVRALQALGEVVMVQPYLAPVDEVGEDDLVFLGGAFSHAVKKNPMLACGAGTTEEPWRQMSWSGLVQPDDRQLAVARTVLDVVTERTGTVPAYARVDLLRDPERGPVLLEVELVDPYLSFDELPGAAGLLVEAVVRRRPG